MIYVTYEYLTIRKRRPSDGVFDQIRYSVPQHYRMNVEVNLRFTLVWSVGTFVEDC
jgi:hypothetical protein